MANPSWIMVTALTLVLSSAQTSRAQSDVLPVHLRNDARVPRDLLANALDLVDRIYTQAGLRLSWIEDGGAITIALRPRASEDTARRASDAMGYTPGEGLDRGRLAFVLLNRVEQVAAGHGVPRWLVLAVAIAHELGHLLLGKEHTTIGLMKSYLNPADFQKAREGRLLFTEEQAEAIRRLEIGR